MNKSLTVDNKVSAKAMPILQFTKKISFKKLKQEVKPDKDN